MLPTTALKPAHIAWSQRARQNRYSHAAAPAHTPVRQCIKAWHINANTSLQLLGPIPLYFPPAAAVGAGAVLAQACAPRLWPAVALGPRAAVALLATALPRCARAGMALQSVLIDTGLRAVAGQWHDVATDISVPPTWGRQVAQRGLLVLPEWALEGAAAHATARGLGAAAAVLLSAAALCPKLATGLRMLGDVHRSLCALPLALAALLLGLTIDLWLIAWRTFQGTASTTESYLFAPCAPPERPRGCWRTREPGPLALRPPAGEDAATRAARVRANLLRLHVHTFLNLEPLLQSDLQLRGLFFSHVQVPAYIEQTAALLLQADTPGQRPLFLDSVTFARIEGPKVEALGERWLAAPTLLAEHTLPVRGECNAEFRNKHLWTLKRAFALTGDEDIRLPFLSAELRAAVPPGEFKRRIAQNGGGDALRDQQLRQYQSDMSALLPQLEECWDISTQKNVHDIDRLFKLLTQDDAFFARLTLCATEVDRQLCNGNPNQRGDLDRQGLEWSRDFWVRISKDAELKRRPRELQRLLHTDKLEFKRGQHAQQMPDRTLTDEEFARLKGNADTMFHLLNTLHKAAKAAHELRTKLAPLKAATKR